MRNDKERPPAPLSGETAGGLDDLYRRYAGWLGSVLRRKLGNFAAEAEDIVQETYIRASRYRMADAKRHPKALLRQIAVNLARDHMRRNVIRGGLALPIDDIDPSADNRLSVAPEQESELLLKQIVVALPARYRDVFVLSRFTGMSNEEIANHFSISVKTVEWRMSKALALCAQQMQD
jgi:RNA polymerase sigma-70 factor (ECF subfamily)